MTNFCESGDQKATVSIKENAIEIERILIEKNLPISIDCSPSHPCGPLGQWLMNFQTPNCGVESSVFSGRRNEIIAVRPRSQSGCVDGTAWELFATCNGGERIINPTASCLCGKLSILSLQFLASEPDGLEIRDSLGALVYQRSVSECDYQVACGDGCPPGYLRCECLSYPGYCCIPCNSIKADIRGARQALRGI